MGRGGAASPHVSANTGRLAKRRTQGQHAGHQGFLLPVEGNLRLWISVDAYRCQPRGARIPSSCNLPKNIRCWSTPPIPAAALAVVAVHSAWRSLLHHRAYLSSWRTRQLRRPACG